MSGFDHWRHYSPDWEPQPSDDDDNIRIIPCKFKYPTDFKGNGNARLSFLYKKLLVVYGEIGWESNKYSARTIIVKGLTDRFVNELPQDLSESKNRLDLKLELAKNLLLEIDALGGRIYIPPELSQDIVHAPTFPPGSLAFLADPDSYFPEVDYPTPSDVKIGINEMQNVIAWCNYRLKPLYETMAENCNRLSFLLICNGEARGSSQYANMYESLRIAYDETLDIIKEAEDHQTSPKLAPSRLGVIFSFPADLKSAVEGIFSKEPTSSKWKEKKQLEDEAKQAKLAEEKERREKGKEKQREEEKMLAVSSTSSDESTEGESTEEETKLAKLAEEKERKEKRQGEEEEQKMLAVPSTSSDESTEGESIEEAKLAKLAEEKERKEKGKEKQREEETNLLLRASPPTKKQKMLAVSSTSSDESTEDVSAVRPANMTQLEFLLREAAKRHIVLKHTRTLHMGNVPWKAEIDDVEKFFGGVAGKVVDVNFPTRNGLRRGFCFVEFLSSEAAAKALKDYQSKELLGRQIVLNFAKPKPDSSGSQKPAPGSDKTIFAKPDSSGSQKPAPGTNKTLFAKPDSSSSQKPALDTEKTIFVRGFDKYLAESEIRSNLYQHFGQCGEISRLSIPTDYVTGYFKGFAFINFKDQNSVSNALELNGSDIGGGHKLYVARSKGSGQHDGGGRSGSGGRGGNR